MEEVSELNNCFVLSPERGAELAINFLDHFLPRREMVCVPEDPAESLGLERGVSLDQVLGHLEVETTERYMLAFSNRDQGDIRFAGLDYNSDGSLILELSVAAESGGEITTRYLKELQTFSKARYAYWGWEEPPVSCAAEFIERVETVRE